MIVSADMVAAMRQGAVVVDMAAETGGNVAGTVAGETLTIGGVTLIGPVNLPSRLAVHASEMYARISTTSSRPSCATARWLWTGTTRYSPAPA